MRVLSLFSGCGGMDLGFEGNFTCLKKSAHPDQIAEDYGRNVLLKKTGFETVFACDIRKDAENAWCSYFARDGVYHIASVVDLVKEGRSAFPENIDVVTGGFPCQDFSVAGKRLGFHSDVSHTGRILEEPSVENRGMLYMQMRNVILLCRPKMFIAENVSGLANLGDAKSVIEHDFSESGDYLVVPAKIMQAADYGVPQSRKRIIFFGFKKSELTPKALSHLSEEVISSAYDPYPAKMFGNSRMPYVTCREALCDLSEPSDSSDMDQQAYSKARYRPKLQGQNEICLDSVSMTIRSEHHGNIEFRRLSKEHGGTHEAELSDGKPERRLTVRECARLQTFPDEYGFLPNVSASSAYQLIGNAVPPLMAYAIARNLTEKWGRYFG